MRMLAMLSAGFGSALLLLPMMALGQTAAVPTAAQA